MARTPYATITEWKEIPPEHIALVVPGSLDGSVDHAVDRAPPLYLLLFVSMLCPLFVDLLLFHLLWIEMVGGLIIFLHLVGGSGVPKEIRSSCCCMYERQEIIIIVPAMVLLWTTGYDVCLLLHAPGIKVAGRASGGHGGVRIIVLYLVGRRRGINGIRSG